MILTGTLYIIYNQRLAFPQWYELVGPVERGGLACAERVGVVGGYGT